MPSLPDAANGNRAPTAGPTVGVNASIVSGNRRSAHGWRRGRGQKIRLVRRCLACQPYGSGLSVLPLLARWWGTVGAHHGGSRRHDDGSLIWRRRVATADAEAAAEGKRKQKQNETRHMHLIGPHAGVARRRDRRRYQAGTRGSGGKRPPPLSRSTLERPLLRSWNTLEWDDVPSADSHNPPDCARGRMRVRWNPEVDRRNAATASRNPTTQSGRTAGASARNVCPQLCSSVQRPDTGPA